MYNMSHSVYINIYESADKVCTMTIVFKIHKTDFLIFFYVNTYSRGHIPHQFNIVCIIICFLD